MSTINGKVCVVDGVAVDKVFSDGKQVYGRNLYLNSKKIADVYGVKSSATVTVEPFDKNTNMWHIISDKGNGSLIGIYLYEYANEKIPNNSDWSYSADVKGTGKVKTFGIEAGSHNPVVGTIGSEWSRISQTGFVDVSRKTIIMYFDSTIPTDIYIKIPKLEIDTTVTHWTPAPEDVM